MSREDACSVPRVSEAGEPVTVGDLVRWSEAVAGLARTGLSFTDSAYDRERYEELMRIAGDMRAAAHDGARAEEHVAAWMSTVADGVFGYATPKVGIGGIVGNDKGELLLIKRSDNHSWFFPTGWADIGYSASEVVVKEVEEECGLEVRPEQVITVFDAFRAGSLVPHYTIVFLCTLIGGELKPHPLECEDIGWFAESDLPEPLLWGETWKALAFSAMRGELTTSWFDPPRVPVWREHLP